MKTKTLASLLIFFIFGACSSPEKAETPTPMMMINIEGVVTGINIYKPIEGVQITVFTFEWGTFKEIFTAKTDQGGYYSIHQTYPRNQCRDKLGGIKAEKKGYKTFHYFESDDYSPDCTEELQKIDFQLEPESWR